VALEAENGKTAIYFWRGLLAAADAPLIAFHAPSPSTIHNDGDGDGSHPLNNNN